LYHSKLIANYGQILTFDRITSMLNAPVWVEPINSQIRNLAQETRKITHHMAENVILISQSV